MWVRSLGQEDPLEAGMATRSSILSWRLPWTKETVGLQSIALQSQTWRWNGAVVCFLGFCQIRAIVGFGQREQTSGLPASLGNQSRIHERKIKLRKHCLVVPLILRSLAHLPPPFPFQSLCFFFQVSCSGFLAVLTRKNREN